MKHTGNECNIQNITPTLNVACKDTALILLELSPRLYKRVQYNSIHLSGLSYSHDYVCYSTVHYGKNIILRY